MAADVADLRRSAARIDRVWADEMDGCVACDVALRDARAGGDPVSLFAWLASTGVMALAIECRGDAEIE